MTSKKYFFISKENLSLLKLLNDEELGAVLRGAINYENNGVFPTELNHLQLTAFARLKKDIDSAKEAYERLRAKNSHNASKRWQRV